MALIKKIDVDKYFAARRAMRLGRIGLLSQPDAAVTVPAGKAAKVPRLIGNRDLGHSSPGVSAPSIPIMSDSGRSQLLRPPGSRQE
jgi:hypothetical protein